MKLIPSIDLLEGRVVRLLKGRYDQVTEFASDAAALAAEWRGHVEVLHVVDLEGARKGRPVQEQAVRRIVEAFGPGVQVGGGVRDRAAVEAYLELGVDRVVMGTAAVMHPERALEIAEAYPHRLVVAVDARDGRVATGGWLDQSPVQAVDAVRNLGRAPIAAVLYTDIERDGTGTGPNIEQTARLARETGAQVIASGGVGHLGHLRSLARAALTSPIWGAIVGRALHEKRFTLKEAVEAAAEPEQD